MLAAGGGWNKSFAAGKALRVVNPIKEKTDGKSRSDQ
jgi:hypothetical protein